MKILKMHSDIEIDYVAMFMCTLQIYTPHFYVI